MTEYTNDVKIVDYFNANIIWSRRLLGIENFEKIRTVDSVNHEYNVDKYLPVLNSNTLDLQLCKKLELVNAGINNNVFISIDNKIYFLDSNRAIEDYYINMKNIIKQYTANLLCELGCGYGYNLSLYDGTKYGGEYSENAVKIGVKLGYDIKYFNYYDESTYDIIKPHTTIFTNHSLEQIPDAQIFIDNLRQHKDYIDCIIHLEPTYLKSRTDFFGMCRNKYIELNDYNRNLLECVKNVDGSEILEYHEDIFSMNPLNPSNLIIWKFN